MRTAKVFLTHFLLLFSTIFAFASDIEITTSSLPNGVVAKAYSETIDASGGCTPYTWSLESGSLPTGLRAEESSSTKSYVISGTPSTVESSIFTVEVTGCGGHSFKKSYSLKIESNYRVTLRWDASTSPDVTGYNVYRGTVSGGPYTEIASHVVDTTYTDATVADDKTYYYVTTAVNKENEQSGYSNQVKAVVP